MQNKYLWVTALCLWATTVFAQSSDSVKYIDVVNVSALKQQFVVTSKIQNLDSLVLSNSSGGSLTDLVNVHLPVYIKQDAGGLSTIRFRGASPDHTAILFEGINLNSLTLGHSNASNIPAFIFDEVKAQFGSSSSLYGSDAIGGSIHLVSKQDWNKGFEAAAQQDVGSFGHYFSGVKLKYSNSRINYALKIYRSQAENNFPFLNLAARDFAKDEFVTDTMKNLAILNSGLLSEMNVKLNNKLVFFTKLWFVDAYHQIQANMSANYYGGSSEDIKNKHSRLFSGFRYYNNNHKLHLTTAYIKDYQLYNKNYDEIIATQSLITNIDYNNSNFLQGELIAGLNYHYINADVYAYNGSIKENRLDLFSAYKRTLFDIAQLSINLREAITQNYKNSFSPSAGLAIRAYDSPILKINVSPSVSRSYKTPSFNDRYWYPNGNPDILAESGMSYDFGVDLKYHTQGTSLKVNISTYLMVVDNWIQWMNMDVWRPFNLKKVQSNGVEVSIAYKKNVGQFTIGNTLNYSYTKAIELENYDAKSKAVNRQLIYTPKHIGNYIFSTSYKTWSVNANVAYTGERFTENYKILAAYCLTNFGLNKKISLGVNTLNICIKASNVFDVAYQNQEYYAMPGRNYRIIIKYLINNLKTK